MYFGIKVFSYCRHHGFFLSVQVCQYHFVFIHQSCVKSLNSFVCNLNLHLKRKKKVLLEVLYGLFCLLDFAALTAEGSDISVLGEVFG